MATMSEPARYFPVRAAPLTMRAALRPLGEDFGNGLADQRYFQLDDEHERYLAAKVRVPASRYVSLASREAHQRAHTFALRWAQQTLFHEYGEEIQILNDEGIPFHQRWQALHAKVQEDFALLYRGDDELGEALCLFVAMPSGWRPEHLAGASFAAIHGPVPGFADVEAAARSMVRAMVERGPYVRFVWTLCADDELDHHPDTGLRKDWSASTEIFLRVERQVTVPLPACGASLFLIRTYVTPIASLDDRQRDTLRVALRNMPDDVAAYKGLLRDKAEILARLGLFRTDSDEERADRGEPSSGSPRWKT